jgi:hypothetical protein
VNIRRTVRHQNKGVRLSEESGVVTTSRSRADARREAVRSDFYLSRIR